MKNPEENKATILIVDDSDVVKHSLKSFFASYNFQVITCSDGLVGIQKATEFKPKLIFLDLMMPKFDGLKMLQVIKEMDELKSVPVIVISANTDRRNVLAVLEIGADRIISKPLRKEVIIKNINEICGNEFLANAVKTGEFSNSESEVIKQHLIHTFLNGFEVKKSAILTALEEKDRDTLRAVVHEIKGNGGTIGYPQLSYVSDNIEKALNTISFDWTYIQQKCEQIFSIVHDINNSARELTT
ncbi:MAG: response regulator [Ignavibacteriaceae bacterium]|jgi:DNA-binding response OmpR family regulator|nr:response regulator [Ignavibacteriaceae bacterium]